MALISPLKKDVEQASLDIDKLHRLYNVYFQGAEEEPPRHERKSLDSLILKIKQQVAISPNAGDKYQANSVVARYQTMQRRWDKALKQIELGLVVRPKKRK